MNFTFNNAKSFFGKLWGILGVSTIGLVVFNNQIMGESVDVRQISSEGRVTLANAVSVFSEANYRVRVVTAVDMIEAFDVVSYGKQLELPEMINKLQSISYLCEVENSELNVVTMSANELTKKSSLNHGWSGIIDAGASMHQAIRSLLDAYGEDLSLLHFPSEQILLPNAISIEGTSFHDSLEKLLTAFGYNSWYLQLKIRDGDFAGVAICYLK